MEQQVPASEAARLDALAACRIMHTPREMPFDNLIFTAAQLFRAPMAAITLVDASLAWAKAQVGPIPKEAARATSFANVVIAQGGSLLIDDAANDPRYSRFDSVAGPLAIRFVLGLPLRGPGNHPIGALCIFDRLTRNTPERHRAQLGQIAAEASELLRLRIPDVEA